MIYMLEDDANIRNFVLYALNNSGLEAKGFERPSEFWAALKEETPSVLLLDIMLPEEDGMQVLAKLRSNPEYAGLPVIMLTAKGSEYDKVIGLDSGADDYVAKPFGTMELISRIKALLRRTTSQETKEYEVGGLYVNTSKHIVRVNGNEVQLTFKEFELLCYLLENIGHGAFTREDHHEGLGLRFRRREPHRGRTYPHAANEARRLRRHDRNCPRNRLQGSRHNIRSAYDETNFRRSVHRFAGRYNFCCCNGARSSLHEGAAAFQEAA